MSVFSRGTIRYLVLGGVSIALLCFVLVAVLNTHMPKSTSFMSVTVGSAPPFRVDVADTGELRTQGLSGRSSLGENAGMFFLFPKAGMYGFWMKDMLFPIDIIWISHDRVVGVSEHVLPGTSPERHVYYPPKFVDKVLEVHDGFVAKYKIAVGDTVTISHE